MTRKKKLLIGIPIFITWISCLGLVFLSYQIETWWGILTSVISLFISFVGWAYIIKENMQ